MFYIKIYFLYNFLITHYKKVLKGGSYFERKKLYSKNSLWK